jgi:hypothetical protein
VNQKFGTTVVGVIEGDEGGGEEKKKKKRI